MTNIKAYSNHKANTVVLPQNERSIVNAFARETDVVYHHPQSPEMHRLLERVVPTQVAIYLRRLYRIVVLG